MFLRFDAEVDRAAAGTGVQVYPDDPGVALPVLDEVALPAVVLVVLLPTQEARRHVY